MNTHVRDNFLAGAEGESLLQHAAHWVAKSNVTWADNMSTGIAPFDGLRTSTGAQNAEVVWDLPLRDGTWTFVLVHDMGTDKGIYTVELNGTSVGTIDGYNASASGYRWSSITGIVISAGTGASRAMKLKMATKNASSSSYVGAIRAFQWLKTA